MMPLINRIARGTQTTDNQPCYNRFPGSCCPLLPRHQQKNLCSYEVQSLPNAPLLEQRYNIAR